MIGYGETLGRRRNLKKLSLGSVDLLKSSYYICLFLVEKIPKRISKFIEGIIRNFET